MGRLEWFGTCDDSCECRGTIHYNVPVGPGNDHESASYIYVQGDTLEVRVNPGVPSGPINPQHFMLRWER